MPHQPDPEKHPKKGPDLRELRIDEVAFGGAGVGRSDGKVVFVPFTIDQEVVDVRLVDVRRSYSRGDLQAIRQASPHRIKPPCPFFEICGGCDYQHITYSHQLTIKQGQVEQALRRIAQLSDPVIRPIQASPNPFGYRNRISVHSDDQNIGFFRKGSRTIVDIPNCLLASEAVNEKLRAFRATRPPDGTHATLRETDQATTFSQTNDAVAKPLLEFVRSHVHGSTLLDGYCGSGFFGHDLARTVKKVIGIDWSEPAIRRAQETAHANEAYLCGDLGELLEQVFVVENPDIVILDPSATGISEAVAAILRERPPAELIYVSCDPATFARDIKRLSSAFRVQEVQPFDMFPQTSEIEVVGILQRR